MFDYGYKNQNRFKDKRISIIKIKQMTKAKAYSLCEAVSDIAFIAAKENYETQDSREKFAQFIEWAIEFEYLHRNVEWGVNFLPEYIDSIKYFAMFKINQWRSI